MRARPVLTGVEGRDLGRIDLRFADEAERDATHWGMTLAPAHIALQMRRDVGLPERPGLLVRAIDAATPAAAGIRQGDVLVAASGEALRSLVDLYDAIHQDGARTIGLRLVRGVRDREVVLSL